MTRRLLNLLTALPLLLCVAAAGGWAWSYRAAQPRRDWWTTPRYVAPTLWPDGRAPGPDRFPLRFAGFCYRGWFVPGGMEVYWQPERRGGSAISPTFAGVTVTTMGFGLNRAPPGFASAGVPWARHGTARAPFWFPTLLFAVAPAWSLLRSVRRGRPPRTARATAACTACGYDLRATPGRCPECGATPVTAEQ
jgi:hypothetical protein